MDKHNVELSDIIPFKEDGNWYLKLIYKYEDEIGKHMVIFPKTSPPFTQRHIPDVNIKMTYDERLPERPYIDCIDSMLLFDSACAPAIERGVETPCSYFDIITEYAVNEMTLDEIENKLGYKVKIINKKIRRINND